MNTLTIIKKTIRGATKFSLPHSELLLIGIFTVLIFSIYSNSFKGPLVFDDITNISDNESIRLTNLTWENIKTAATSLGSKRPIPKISFALNYYFHGYNVSGYHLVNIVIHIIIGILLYFFLTTTLIVYSKDFNESERRLISFFSSLIWLVHPIQTQSVTYIVQRMNSMAAMFFILTLLLYVQGRNANKKEKSVVFFCGCVVSGLLAVSSKENAATLPVFIFLYEWFFFQNLSIRWLKKNYLAILAVVVVMSILTVMSLGYHPFENILGGYSSRDFTPGQRVLTQFRVIIFYISLLIFPHPSRMNLDHDFPLSYSLIDPITTCISMMLIFLLVGMAIVYAKRERLLSFCVFWFFGNLVIESSLIGLEMIFEHRTYLPSMFFAFLLVILCYRFNELYKISNVFLLSVVLLFSSWTYARNGVWADEVTLWRDTAEKSPGKARSQNNLGRALIKTGDFERAVHHLFKTLKINPNYFHAHLNLGLAFMMQSKHNEAASHFSHALRIDPNYAGAHINLSAILMMQQKLDEAASHLYEVLRTDPNYVTAHVNLGVILMMQQKLDEAASHLYEALRINPNIAEAHINLGVILTKQEKLDEAASHYSTALSINPGNTDIRLELENILRLKDKSVEQSNTDR